MDYLLIVLMFMMVLKWVIEITNDVTKEDDVNWTDR